MPLHPFPPGDAVIKVFLEQGNKVIKLLGIIKSERTIKVFFLLLSPSYHFSYHPFLQMTLCLAV